MKILNGYIIPYDYDPSKRKFYKLEAQTSRQLAKKLAEYFLTKPNLEMINNLFNTNKHFFKTMVYEDPWENLFNNSRSIVEVTLKKLKFNFPDDYILNVLNLYINSDEAKTKEINILHVLARNIGSQKIDNLLRKVAEAHPSLLVEKMHDKNNTPLEIILEKSKNEELILFLIDLLNNQGLLDGLEENKIIEDLKKLTLSEIWEYQELGNTLLEKVSDLFLRKAILTRDCAIVG